MDGDEKSRWKSQVKDIPLFSERMAELFNQQKTSDVCLLIDKTQYYVHKNILSRVSPAFRKLFDEESSVGSDDDIVVQLTETDDCLAVFPLFLRYFYCGPASVSLNARNVVQLLILATKYEVDMLRKECLDWMFVYLDTAADDGEFELEVVCDWALHGYIREDVEPQHLRQKCLEILKAHMNIVIDSVKWAELPLEYILILLQDDDLKVSDEYVLFQAVENWLLESGRKRAQSKFLSPVLQLVRFPMMTFEELSLIQESSILYSENKDEFQKHLEDARRFHCLKITEGRSEISRHVIGNYTRKYSTRKYTRTLESAPDQAKATNDDAKETDVAIAAELLSNGFEVSVYHLHERSAIESSATRREADMPKIINGAKGVFEMRAVRRSKSEGQINVFPGAKNVPIKETQSDVALDILKTYDHVELSDIDNVSSKRTVDMNVTTTTPNEASEEQSVCVDNGEAGRERPIVSSPRLMSGAVSVDSSEYSSETDVGEQSKRTSVPSVVLKTERATADTQTDLSLLDREVYFDAPATGGVRDALTVTRLIRSPSGREHVDSAGGTDDLSAGDTGTNVFEREIVSNPDENICFDPAVEQTAKLRDGDIKSRHGDQISKGKTVISNDAPLTSAISSHATTGDDAEEKRSIESFADEENNIIEDGIDIAVHSPLEVTLFSETVIDNKQEQSVPMETDAFQSRTDESRNEKTAHQEEQSDQHDILDKSRSFESDSAKLKEDESEMSRRHGSVSEISVSKIDTDESSWLADKILDDKSAPSKSRTEKRSKSTTEKERCRNTTQICELVKQKNIDISPDVFDKSDTIIQHGSDHQLEPEDVTDGKFDTDNQTTTQIVQKL